MTRGDEVRAELVTALAAVGRALRAAAPFRDDASRIASERLAGDISSDLVRLLLATGAQTTPTMPEPVAGEYVGHNDAVKDAAP